MIVLGVIALIFTLGIWIWAHRAFEVNSRFPGYAWVATPDGTSISAMHHIRDVLGNRGIPSLFDSMMAADFYVPTNQIAEARLILAVEKLKHWHSIWSLH
jgi:hypothetical protein